MDSSASERTRHAIISRDVGSEYIVIYSRHGSAPEAVKAANDLARKFNKDGVTKHLSVVSL